jgi:hypothetical protein
MSGSEYLLWSYGQFEKMTIFPPDPLIVRAGGVVTIRERLILKKDGGVVFEGVGRALQ